MYVSLFIWTVSKPLRTLQKTHFLFGTTIEEYIQKLHWRNAYEMIHIWTADYMKVIMIIAVNFQFKQWE